MTVRTFVRGEKTKLSELTASLQVTVRVAIEGADTYDISCFGVDAAGKLSDDRYFIFYNQRTSPEGAITSAGPGGGDLDAYTIDLARLPAGIQKLVFTTTIDGSGTMSTVRSGSLRVFAGGTEVAAFSFSGSNFRTEKALIIGELYKKDIWRFAAVGQGFNGGLPALLSHFGGKEVGASTPPPPPPPSPSAPAAPKVNLGKVTLDKTGDKRTVSLAKGVGNQPIHVNLNWNQQGGTRRRGIFSGGASPPDLDLGCMYQMKDGSKNVIQPLGNNFGNQHGPPFIYLDKDDRSGADADGENLYLMRPDQIRRVMVFAMIYEGASDFSSVGGRMTLRDQSGAVTEIHLNSPDSNRTFCSVCVIEESGGQLTITKEERYFKGHSDADNYYGFGFSWRAGRK